METQIYFKENWVNKIDSRGIIEKYEIHNKANTLQLIPIDDECGVKEVIAELINKGWIKL